MENISWPLRTCTCTSSPLIISSNGLHWVAKPPKTPKPTAVLHMTNQSLVKPAILGIDMYTTTTTTTIIIHALRHHYHHNHTSTWTTTPHDHMYIYIVYSDAQKERKKKQHKATQHNTRPETTTCTCTCITNITTCTTSSLPHMLSL